MYLLYSLAATLALLLSAPWWLFRMLRHDKYRAGLRERLGAVPTRLCGRDVACYVSKEQSCIWIHAVSVGEVLAVGQLIKELSAANPGTRIFLSTTTAAGQKLARERHGEENVFYFPLDFAFAIRPYFKRLQPKLVILAETEFWPNFLRLARRSGAKVAVVNARISNRSYGGYRRWRGVLRRFLQNVDLFLTQSPEDAKRLIEIGALPEQVATSGNLKFDVQPPQAVPLKEELKERLQKSEVFPILVCGSTVEGEEFPLLGMFQQVLRKYPKAVMILAPRHPERFDAVAQLVSSFGVPPGTYPHLPGLTRLNFWRRSQLDPQASLSGGVLLLDSIGELAALYALATIAFVGGSLVPRGGHNILEPAYFGVPILVGPHMENFRDIVAIFQTANAVKTVHGFRVGNVNADLSNVVLQLLENTSEREALGQRAAEVMKLQTGATARTAKALQELMTSSSVVNPPLREQSIR
ncbi:MAG TPA: 3-deoxy-D-manno-octulosonic acid transferase [Terriglobales bacterium]|nr:3-deoxy-D-manno-octulosonic acid transferase [Terriglobales bacterium]